MPPFVAPLWLNALVWMGTFWGLEDTIKLSILGRKFIQFYQFTKIWLDIFVAKSCNFSGVSPLIFSGTHIWTGVAVKFWIQLYWFGLIEYFCGKKFRFLWSLAIDLSWYSHQESSGGNTENRRRRWQLGEDVLSATAMGWISRNLFHDFLKYSHLRNLMSANWAGGEAWKETEENYRITATCDNCTIGDVRRWR